MAPSARPKRNRPKTVIMTMWFKLKASAKETPNNDFDVLMRMMAKGSHKLRIT